MVHKKIHVNTLHIYGDSRNLVDGIKGNTTFDPPLLSRWIERIKHITHTLPGITVQHIYHESTTVVESLSKEGLGDAYGVHEVTI